MKIDRKLIYNKYGGHCSYCGKELKFKDMQVDHLEAKSNKKPVGRDLEGNYIYPDIDRYDNLMPSCRRCNHYKRAEPLSYFRIMVKTLHERISNFYIVKVAIDFGLIEFKKWDELFYFEKYNNEKIHRTIPETTR